MASASTNGDNSFVEVGRVSPNMDFVVKIGVQQSSGPSKYYRLQLEELVNKSTRQVDIAQLSEILTSRSPNISLLPEFSYRDLDGDLCLIDTTKDLLDAVQQFRDKGHVKLEAAFTRPQPAAQVCDADASAETCVVQPTPNGGTPSTYEERVQRAMQGASVATPQPRPDANLDHLEEGDPDEVRAHIWDEFEDHCNLDNPREFYRGEDLGDEWVVSTKYNLNGRHVKSQYLAFDDVYLDLTVGPSPDGYPLVRMAIPSLLLVHIADQIAGIKSPYPPPATSLDPVMMAFSPNAELFKMGEDLVSTSEGFLVDLIENGECNHFFKASAVFSIHAMKDPVSLSIELVEVLAFSEADDVLEELMNSSSCGADDGFFGDENPFDRFPGWTMPMNSTFGDGPSPEMDSADEEEEDYPIEYF